MRAREAIIDVLVKPADHRRAARQEVRMIATLRESGSSFRFEVEIRDIAATGVQFETNFTLRTGNSIYLTLPGLVPLGAVIMWQHNRLYGARFDRALYQAVCDHIAISHRKF